jgi:hypothetical protein
MQLDLLISFYDPSHHPDYESTCILSALGLTQIKDFRSSHYNALARWYNLVFDPVKVFIRKFGGIDVQPAMIDPY